MTQQLAPRMTTLQGLFPGEVFDVYGGTEILGLTLDSRAVVAGDCFIAVPGEQSDGRDFIEAAIGQGASVVLSATSKAELTVSERLSVPVVEVPNLQQRLSDIAGRFYGQPSDGMTLVGITGTNGKTTSSQWLAQVLNGLQGKSATIGTLGYGLHGESLQMTGMTTPDAVTSQRVLGELARAGADSVVVEVSSHGLALGRVDAVSFDVAVVTNIGRDHLDFHGDEVSYVAAKIELMKFASLKSVVLNLDDRYFDDFKRAAGDTEVVSVALVNREADYYFSKINYGRAGISVCMETPEGGFELSLSLWGEFNLYNILCVVAAAVAAGHNLDDVMLQLNDLSPVPGRLEPVSASADGASDIAVVVDFAHTPDALESALKALRKHSAAKVCCVFGCGGDRDAGKRPLMAKVAEQFSDRVILTSDNPRTETPGEIIAQVCEGFSDDVQLTVIEDRAQAIEEAVLSAETGDLVLLAGKGHEDYQIVGREKLPFSDLNCARWALNKRVGVQA